MKKKDEQQDEQSWDEDDVTPALVYVPVRVIRQQGDALLVEFWDQAILVRVTVPAASLVDDNTVNWDDLQAGIPYGIPFEEIVNPILAPVEIANALHKAGYWTIEDLRRNFRGVVAVMQSIYGLEAASLLQAAEQFEKRGEK